MKQPGWAKGCPEAYAEYCAAQDDLRRIVRNPLKQSRVGVLLARAWTAGQNSIAEQERNWRAECEGKSTRVETSDSGEQEASA